MLTLYSLKGKRGIKLTNVYKWSCEIPEDCIEKHFKTNLNKQEDGMLFTISIRTIYNMVLQFSKELYPKPVTLRLQSP